MLVLRVIAVGSLCLTVGCQGSFFNPFGASGPTQVPPPPTGSARRPDPYYRSSLPDTSPRLSQRTFNSYNDRLPERSVASRQAPLDNGTDYRVPVDREPLDDSTLDWRHPSQSYEVPAVDGRPRVRLPNDTTYSQIGDPRYDANVQPASAQSPITTYSTQVPHQHATPAAVSPQSNNGWSSATR